MSKKSVHNNKVNTKGNSGTASGFDDEWDVVPTGFAPIWKHDESKVGAYVQFIPIQITKIEATKTKGKNKNDSYLLNSKLVGVHASGFFQKDTEVKVNRGDEIAVGLSATLISTLDHKRLAYQGEDDPEPVISKLAEYCRDKQLPMMVTFTGKQKSSTKGHNPMKVYELRVKKGVMEECFQQSSS